MGALDNAVPISEAGCLFAKKGREASRSGRPELGFHARRTVGRSRCSRPDQVGPRAGAGRGPRNFPGAPPPDARVATMGCGDDGNIRRLKSLPRASPAGRTKNGSARCTAIRDQAFGDTKGFSGAQRVRTWRVKRPCKDVEDRLMEVLAWGADLLRLRLRLGPFGHEGARGSTRHKARALPRALL